ncbi:hypothetical protein LUZ60_004850 [Juncus effusus]|nr:hypothetical protein LUZ60_004850 [Juncus effusus]
MRNLAFLSLLIFSSLLVACNASSRSLVATTLCKHNITIHQWKTGRVVEGQPEYKVKITNPCRFDQSNVIINCFGLSSVEPLDPSLIKPIDNKCCIISRGEPIKKGEPVWFKYAWLTPQDLTFVSSRVERNL